MDPSDGDGLGKFINWKNQGEVRKVYQQSGKVSEFCKSTHKSGKLITCKILFQLAEQKKQLRETCFELHNFSKLKLYKRTPRIGNF